MLKDIRSAVRREIREVLEEEGLQTPGGEPAGDSTITDLGLESLMFARVILRLEQELGVDPFAADMVVADVRTVDDLAAAYERALATAA
jgi:acyl carrier protein